MISVDALEDPRLAPYRDLKNRPARDRTFIAEGPRLVERLLASSCDVESVLVGARHATRFADAFAPSTTVLIAEETLLEQLVGFHFHRGVLACGVRPEPRRVSTLLARVPDRALYLVCPEVNEPENLGAICRAAGAFGVTAVLLGERCCDPFSRRCLRVSIGAVLELPIVQTVDLRADLQELRDRARVELLAAVVDDAAESLASFDAGFRTAVLLGTEADGLHRRFLEICDRRVTIPMQGPSDSLNVGAAAAVLLYGLRR